MVFSIPLYPPGLKFSDTKLGCSMQSVCQITTNLKHNARYDTVGLVTGRSLVATPAESTTVWCRNQDLSNLMDVLVENMFFSFARKFVLYVVGKYWKLIC